MNRPVGNLFQDHPRSVLMLCFQHPGTTGPGAPIIQIGGQNVISFRECDLHGMEGQAT